MGVKNLWDILESCKKTLPLHHLQNKRVCVDLSCWMVQLHNVNKSHCSIKDKLYLKGLFHRIRALIALNCSIIFVTDGSIPGIKVSTYRRRLHLDNEATREESSSNTNTSIRRNMGSEFSCMIKEAKILGLALGVPCLDGIEEGEAQCALLDAESLCDGCFSSDSDIFLFGARTVYRDICLGEGGYVVCYEMADIERKLGFGRNSLIALGVLLGSDYSPGVHGLGPESACQIVKSLGEFSVLQRIASEELTLLKKANCSKKRNKVVEYNNKENIPPHESNINGHKSNLPRNNQFMQVMDAYLKPKCHSADSQSVNRVLGMHPFQRTALQQTCAQFFEWPPEKTDEYILSKIAERDLRRFANLRCTSSLFGVRLLLDEMPVKCPVSGIIKRRKAHGKECFEVSWEDVDGLSSSIVPAELVESACPERILEFEDRLAEKKKPKPRKPRSKKLETNQSLSEKLQELLLETKSTSSSTHKLGLIDEPDEATISNSKELKTMENLIGTTSSSVHSFCLIDESVEDTRSNSKEMKTIGNLTKSSSARNFCLIDESVEDARSSNREAKLTENVKQSCSVIETEVVNLSTPLVDSKSNRRVENETDIVDLLSPFSSGDCRWKDRAGDVIELSESETEVSPEHAKKARELRLFVASITIHE